MSPEWRVRSAGCPIPGTRLSSCRICPELLGTMGCPTGLLQIPAWVSQGLGLPHILYVLAVGGGRPGVPGPPPKRLCERPTCADPAHVPLFPHKRLICYIFCDAVNGRTKTFSLSYFRSIMFVGEPDPLQRRGLRSWEGSLLGSLTAQAGCCWAQTPRQAEHCRARARGAGASQRVDSQDYGGMGWVSRGGCQDPGGQPCLAPAGLTAQPVPPPVSDVHAGACVLRSPERGFVILRFLFPRARQSTTTRCALLVLSHPGDPG